MGLQVAGHYFNNVWTIERKTRAAVEQWDLGGVMIWEIGQVSSRRCYLLQTFLCLYLILCECVEAEYFEQGNTAGPCNLTHDEHMMNK